MNVNNKYYSYSYDLTKWLLKNGLSYESKGVHNKTGKHFYVFERCATLSKLLQDYHDNK